MRLKTLTPGLTKAQPTDPRPGNDEKSAPAVSQPLRPTRAGPARRKAAGAPARGLSGAGVRLYLRRAPAGSGYRLRLQGRGAAARARRVARRAAPPAPGNAGEFFAGSSGRGGARAGDAAGARRTDRDRGRARDAARVRRLRWDGEHGGRAAPLG